MSTIFCINCNIASTQQAPLQKCTLCGKPNTDEYYSFHSSLVILDVLLFRVGAFRHILRNRFKEYPKNYILMITITLYIIFILLELFNKQKSLILSKSHDEEIPITNIVQMVVTIGSNIGYDISVLLVCLNVFYYGSIKKKVFNCVYMQKKITMLQIVFSLMVCQYARLSNILFVIWDHSSFLKQMGSLSIKLAQLSAVRALVEDHQQWIMPTVVVTISSITLGVIRQQILGVEGINIL